MIKTIFFCIAAFIFFAACNKKDTTTVVKLQVIAINSSKIDIVYNNILGNKLTASANNGWEFDITDPPKPYTAYIQATSTSPFSSITTNCTVNILVNGSIVKTATDSSKTQAIAEAEYTLQ